MILGASTRLVAQCVGVLTLECQLTADALPAHWALEELFRTNKLELRSESLNPL